jgi:hypothetical protein
MTLPKDDASSGSSANQLSPRRAVIFGVICILFGTYPVLAGLGVVHGHMSPGVQPWLGVAAGSMFILAGLAIINGYVFAGRLQPNGDFSAETPFLVKLTQFVLGVAIIGLMFAMFAWVSFGSGERHFSSSISVPGLSSSGQSSERSGRIVFGIGAVVLGFFFVASVVSGAKRLWRGSRAE